MLASSGDITPPCGVPLSLPLYFFLPSSSSTTGSFRSESIGVFLKIRFKYRFYYYLYRHLHYPVFCCRYPQRPFAAIRLRDIYPSDRHGLIGLVLQFIGYACKIHLLPAFPLPYVLKGYTVNSTGSFV